MNRWLQYIIFLNLATGSASKSASGSHGTRFPKFFDSTTDDDFESSSCSNLDFHGRGREWDLFETKKYVSATTTRGGSDSGSDSSGGRDEPSLGLGSSTTSRYYPSNKNVRRRKRSRSGGRAGGRRRTTYDSSKRDTENDQDGSSKEGLLDWFLGGGLPKVQIRAEPQTIIKVRKRFRPLKTILTLGADFNMGLGIWQFKSGWEDPIIGGRLTLAGRELQLSKTWLLSVGVVEDLVTRLRFRAAVDMSTGKAYARLGFRTERLSPINVVEGFTGKWMIPLDRPENKVKLEVKANFAFPEPEIEYSTENSRTLVGMGDIEVSLDELNLVLDL